MTVRKKCWEKQHHKKPCNLDENRHAYALNNGSWLRNNTQNPPLWAKIKTPNETFPFRSVQIYTFIIQWNWLTQPYTLLSSQPTYITFVQLMSEISKLLKGHRRFFKSIFMSVKNAAIHLSCNGNWSYQRLCKSKHKGKSIKLLITDKV